MSVDDTRNVTIQLSVAIAQINKILVRVISVATGGLVDYDVLLGQQPIAAPGDTITILVGANNNGGNGIIFIEVLVSWTGQTQYTLWAGSWDISAGGATDIFVDVLAGNNPLTMPNTQVNFTVNVGHQ